MALKQRYQDPVVGDTIRLRLDVYNRNSYSDVFEIQEVNVYYLDPTARSSENPDGRVLFATLPPDQIVHEDTGKYYVDLVTTSPNYVIGTYVDSWSVVFEEGERVSSTPNENFFNIFASKWITSPIPIIYDFSFRFSPSKIVKGSNKYLRIEIAPQVPQHHDLVRYYYNLSVVADVTVSISQICGNCLPQEEDLRIIVEDAPVDFREKNAAFYKLDTTDMDCGIYDIWFKMSFGDNVFVSEKQQFQIYT